MSRLKSSPDDDDESRKWKILYCFVFFILFVLFFLFYFVLKIHHSQFGPWYILTTVNLWWSILTMVKCPWLILTDRSDHGRNFEFIIYWLIIKRYQIDYEGYENSRDEIRRSILMDITWGPKYRKISESLSFEEGSYSKCQFSKKRNFKIPLLTMI